MPLPALEFVSPFLKTARKADIPVILLKEKAFKAWLKKQPPAARHTMDEMGFQSKKHQVAVIRSAKGAVERVVVGVTDPCGVYDMGHAVQAIKQALSKNVLKGCSFTLRAEGLSKSEINAAALGWGLSCYQYTVYKGERVAPALVWPKGADQKTILSTLQSIFLCKDLINTPANDLGPDEMEQAARKVATAFKAKINVIRGQKLEKDFPLVHIVGHGSERRPRLIDITWGNPKHPKVTLIGKGVSFDTGGLNLKPAAYMALMKKDMGGAAHVLALGRMIMDAGLPVRLRILIPSVENSVSGGAFRPGDVLRSRKGLTVENTNTDAEGRLILADALTYACEEKPQLLIDFATLTGSARAGLGPDIPPVFSTNDKLAAELKQLSFEIDDPVWPMPLWLPYKKLIESSIADLINSSSVPGDLIFSAVFLKQFLTGNPDWLHLDIYAWEHTGRAGRPKGGADTGLRAVYALIEKRYGR